MTNPTLSTESVVVFVNEYNKEAIDNIKSQTPADDVDMRPGMDLEAKEDDRVSKLERKYKIQEGAGQGKSICRIVLTSQA